MLALTGLILLAAAVPLSPLAGTATGFVLPQQAMQITQNQYDDDGFFVDTLTWRDGPGRKRTVSLVHNDQEDPMGYFGGYLRQYTWDAPEGARACGGSSAYHPGFGYTVNHYGSDGTGVASSRRHKGTQDGFVFRGTHHALYQQRWTYPIDGHPVDVTVQWLFATGRNNPLYAITYDMKNAPADAIYADTRAPYGDIAWDGDRAAVVDGVQWGDSYKFESQQEPLTTASGWDYTAFNTIPFALAYSIKADAEMGLVQTEPQSQRPAGGYAAFKYWGDTGRSAMPAPQDWPFQINQWELSDKPTLSKRMAWGSNYGAVGQRNYPGLGGNVSASGWPYQSYSTFVVVGAHSSEDVMTQVREMEDAQRTDLTVSSGGRVVTEGPAGINRTDAVVWIKPGYNPVYASWEAIYAGESHAPMTLGFERTGSRALASTLLVVHAWPSADVEILINGSRLRLNDQRALTSYDAAHQTLWMTLQTPLSAGTTTLQLSPIAASAIAASLP